MIHIIDGARSRIATYVNTEAGLTNWSVGKRIKEDVLFNKRAEYGKQVVINLSVKLTERYGNGWSEKTLRHCLRAAETFSEEEIVYATRIQLSWTHLRSLMFIKDPLERQFYAQMCSSELTIGIRISFPMVLFSKTNFSFCAWYLYRYDIFRSQLAPFLFIFWLLHHASGSVLHVDAL